MKRKCWFLSCLLLALATPVTAAVFERDWLASGDGLLTFDYVNMREWLDLSESLLEQFPGSSLEENYQSVVAETEAGGMFDGFAVAKVADVIALAESAGIDLTTRINSINRVPTKSLMELLGVTYEFGDDKRTMGFLDELSATPISSNERWVSIFRYGTELEPNIAGSGLSLSVASLNLLIRSSTAGVMLYRNAIPEPSSLFLSILGLIFFNTGRSTTPGATGSASVLVDKFLHLPARST